MMMCKKRDNWGKNKTECFGSLNRSSFYNAELKLLDKVHETKGFLVSVIAWYHRSMSSKIFLGGGGINHFTLPCISL